MLRFWVIALKITGWSLMLYAEYALPWYNFMVLLPGDAPLISQSLITFSLSLLLETEFLLSTTDSMLTTNMEWQSIVLTDTDSWPMNNRL